MSIREEFKKQWKSFSAVIESEMIRLLRENDQLDVEKIRSVIKRETAKWSNRSLYEGIWLDKIKQSHSALGAELGQKLKDTNISDCPRMKYPSLAPGILLATAAGIVGFLVSRASMTGFFRIAGFTVIPMFLVGTVMLGLWQDVKKKKKRQLIDITMQQLKEQGLCLEEICGKLDEAGLK